MLTIELDVAGISVQLAGKTLQAAQSAIEALSAFASDRIQTYVDGSNLAPEMRTRYLDALKTERKASSVRFTLDDPAVERLEAGTAAWDMKPKMLAKATKYSQSGDPYVDVPFLHRTTKRVAPGRPKKSKPVPTSLRAAVRKAQSKATKTGKPVRVKGARRHPNYQDMVHHPAQPEAVTFRRISPNSAPNSWVYPEKEGIGAFDATLEDVDVIKDEVFRDYLAQAGVSK